MGKSGREGALALQVRGRLREQQVLAGIFNHWQSEKNRLGKRPPLVLGTHVPIAVLAD